MHSLAKSMRNRLPALGLGLMAAFGVAGAATIAMAPAAYAAPKVNEKIGPILQEAQAAIKARNWPTAEQKLAQAAPLASSREEKLYVEMGRFAIAQGKKDYKAVVVSAEALIAMNAPNSAQLKKNLPGFYEASGNSAKALQLLKAEVDSGNGSAADYFRIGAASYKLKNYPDALKYGNLALQKAGAKPPKDYFELVMSVYKDTGKEAEYLSTMEKAVVIYPNESWWNTLFVRVQKDPAYKPDLAKVDLFRLKQAAKVKVPSKDKISVAAQAQFQRLSAEAVAILTPMPTDLAAGDLASANQTLSQAKGKQDEATVDKQAAADTAAGRGADMVLAAEQYMGLGKYDKAIDLFQKGLAKNIADPQKADYARLHLGVAQFKAGKKADAQATWATIKTDTCAKQLAYHWALVSKS